ncbi:phage major capsid protein [Streptomyces sp. NPDC088732]|uniref:phage major capsid protein n=1 Tax=Streptomyces sp. NPDC088732 TaxID=3365879 RepID=UPI00381F1B5B
MSERLKKLIDEQNTLWNRMQEIQSAGEAEGRDWTAEERTNWDAAEARLTEVSGDIDRLNRAAHLNSIDRGQIVTTTGDQDDRREGGDDRKKRYADAFGLYMRGGMDRLSVEQRLLLADGQVDMRAMGANVDTAGGYLVPDEFRGTMTEAMKAYGGLLNLATVIPTSTGADLSWPTNDDTGNEGEILGENQQAGEQDVQLGGRKLKAFTYSSKTVRVALTLLQDSAFSLDTWLPKKLGERIGRRAARSFITGTGVDQPEGITTNVTVGKTGANGQTTSIIYDDLVDLEHSVDSAYRANAKYLMGDTALKVIRKLKDGQQRPLWVPIPAPGFPATINGFEYALDNGMPAPAANAKSLVFGDIAAGYLIRQVLDVQMMRLTERYADYLQVGFLGFARFDGMVDDTQAIRAYAHSAT